MDSPEGIRQRNFQFCWSGMFIPDPGSRIRMFPILDPGSCIQIFSILDPWSQIWIFSIPDPGSRMHIKEFKYFNQKNGFSALRNIIRVFHPGSGSRIWILTIYLSQIPILDPRSQIQGSKRHRIPDPGSRIRIRNTRDCGFAQAIGGSVGYWLTTAAAVIDQLSEAFMWKKNSPCILFTHYLSNFYRFSVMMPCAFVS